MMGSGTTLLPSPASWHLIPARPPGDADPLCAALAATEAALIARLQNPDAPSRTIAWPCDPGPVLAALLRGEGPANSPKRRFTLTVGPSGGRGLAWCRGTD
jgi:hypothetical protein